MELFPGNREKAPSTSKMVKTSVKAISLEALEPSTKEWVDEFVRNLTEGFKNAMPKPSQRVSRRRSKTPNRNQPSIAQAGSRIIRMEDEILTTETITGADPTAKIRTKTNRMTTKTAPKDPANSVNVTVTPRTIVKLVSSVEILDTSAMNAEAKRPTI